MKTLFFKCQGLWKNTFYFIKALDYFFIPFADNVLVSVKQIGFLIKDLESSSWEDCSFELVKLLRLT